MPPFPFDRRYCIMPKINLKLISLSMQGNLASIDVGTNTIRLWIGKIKTKSMLTLHTDRANVRLGEGLKHSAVISKNAVARAVPVLSSYKELIEKNAVTDFRAVGTKVFREASNGKEIAESLYRRTGVSIDIISGEEEARLCLKGALWDLILPSNRILVVDIGGGSTELIMTKDSRIEALHSIDMGAVSLTEAYFHHDPPSVKEIENLKTYIADRLVKIAVLEPFKDIATKGGYTLVGTAGTATTLAAIDLGLRIYMPDLIHGHVLTKNKLLALFNQLRLKKAKGRLALPGLEHGREDIVLAGLMAWIEVLRAFFCQEITVSNNGILEGIAISLGKE